MYMKTWVASTCVARSNVHFDLASAGRVSRKKGLRDSFKPREAAVEPESIEAESETSFSLTVTDFLKGILVEREGFLG